MCIIALKFKGSDFPSAQTISTCMQTNRDGFAIAWNENGRLNVFKTMDASEMLEKYRHVSSLDPATTGMVFHARIATHGSKKVENCHLWTDKSGRLAFAHNGMLHNVEVHDDMTDSEVFFRDYFLPVMEKCGPKVARRVADAIRGSSKFALINDKGDILPMGEYIKEKDLVEKGCTYFSNGNYRRGSFQFAGIFDQPPVRHTPKCGYPNARKSAGPLYIRRDDNGKVVHCETLPLR